MRVGWVILLTALVAAGCDIGPVRRVPQEPAPPAAVPATPEVSPRHEVRFARLPVPPGSVLRKLELADSRHGYALVVTCAQGPAASAPAGRPEPDGCPAALAATVDGGLTWQSRQHPRPVAPGQQLYVGGARLVLLHADPYGWYVSTDAGLTFAFRPGSAPPPEYATVAGRYGVWCEPAPCRVVEGYPPGGGRRPVPAQPDLPGELVTVAQAGAHELWAVSVAQGRAYPAVSLDQGRSWQRRDLPGPVGGSSGSPDGRPVSRVELRVSPDGRDVWLLGFGPAARLEFPRLWLHGPGGWRVRHAGDPAPVAHAFAAAGGQALVVAGPGGLGVVGDGYATFGDWPSATGYVRALPDGALVAAADTTGTDTTGTGERLWLGVGRGTDRRWIEVIVRTS